jgi:hypothetical protein
MVPRRAVMHTVAMLPGGAEVLPDHHPAISVPHDLAVGHAVALADRPFREIVVRGVAVGSRPVVRSRVAGPTMGLGAAMRRGVPLRMMAAVIGIVLPRRDSRVMRERGQRLGRRSRQGRRNVGRGRRR